MSPVFRFCIVVELNLTQLVPIVVSCQVGSYPRVVCFGSGDSDDVRETQQ